MPDTGASLFDCDEENRSLFHAMSGRLAEPETLRERFSEWGISLTPECMKDGFCQDQTENRHAAQTMFHDMQSELLARLICTEAVAPFDVESISEHEAENRINNLPALLCSKCIWKDGDDFRPAKF